MPPGQRPTLLLAGFSLLAALLAGCTTGGTAATEETVKALFRQGPTANPTNPQFSYLRTTVDGRSFHLVLGYDSPTPTGLLQAWYSRGGEVVQLHEGRLSSTAGLATDWRRSNSAQAPSWDAVVKAMDSGEPLPNWQQQRDEMPGYRFGRTDTRTLRATQAPNPLNFEGSLPADVVWVEELSVAGLPPSLFAVRRQALPDRDRVVWSRQCLSAELCFVFQPWTPNVTQP